MWFLAVAGLVEVLANATLRASPSLGHQLTGGSLWTKNLRKTHD